MAPLRTLLASLGAPGAARNASLAVAARRAEDEAIAALARRLAPPARTVTQVA